MKLTASALALATSLPGGLIVKHYQSGTALPRAGAIGEVSHWGARGVGMGFLDRVSQLVHRLSSRASVALMAANDRLGGVPLLLKRTFDGYNAHDGSFVSVALAYYFLLTTFPLILALIALGSLLLGSERAQQAALAFAAQALPGAEGLIASNISLVLKQRGSIGVLALLGLIYSASGLFGVLAAALDRAWACRGRPTLEQRLLAVAGVLGMAALFFLSVGFGAAYEALRRAGGPNQGLRAFLVTALPLLVSYAFTLAMFLVLYWKLPAARVRFADAWPAALLAGVAWEAAKGIFAWYLSRFTQYNLVYGSLAAVIGLLAWFQFTGFIILLGAELSVQVAARHGRGPAAKVC